ncbi:MAG: ERCC4 domain-containing protein, partial [Promethearchaeota archaeon]
LPVADYIVSSKIGIERKRGDDFAASLCDGRFFEQLERMNSTFKRPMIILEDFTRMFSQNIYEQSLLGALTYAMFKLNIPIIPTQNSIETARTIWSIAKAEQKIEKFKYISLPKKEQKIDKKAQVYFLEGLMNVSVKKANILLDKWKTPGNVLNAILKTEITKTKAGKEKGISGPLTELKGFGLKFLKSNKELLDIIND